MSMITSASPAANDLPPHRTRRRGLVFALLALFVVVGAGLIWLGGRPSADVLARREAARQAEALRTDLLRSPVPGAGQVRRLAAAREGVTILRVDGVDRRRPPGIEVLFQVSATVTRAGFLGIGERSATVEPCFRLLLEASAGNPMREASCAAQISPPSGALPADVEQRLRAALVELAAGPAVSEDDVLAALERMGIGADGVAETSSQAGAVGVAVRDRSVCVLGRAQPGAAEVWRVANIQYQPGELGCTPTEALARHGQAPPK